MALHRPLAIVIAGPNGAGKSTTAPSLLRDASQVSEFVNADAIAGGLSAFRPDSVAIPAGRGWSHRDAVGARRRLPTHRSGAGFRRSIVSNLERTDTADQRVQDVAVVEEALARAVGDALRSHKRAGNPVPEWRDGKVRWLTPGEIPDLADTPGEA